MTNASNRRTRRSSGPTGTPRSGRRETARHRQGAGGGLLERWRTPLVVVLAVALVGVVGAIVVSGASAANYECATIDAVEPDAALGQIQKDLGNAHVDRGDSVTYPICPPASGKHVNRVGFGPLEPRVYGPDDRSEPQGWIHNLEHGGLVLLYSCDRGACDDATLEELRQFSSGFPTSAVCQLAPGTVGPVVARFEQMPTRFAALVWGRALYLEELDEERIYEFFREYGERVTEDGRWLAPPEPQCPAPTPTPSASPSASPGASPSASPSAEPSPSAS